MPCPPREAPGSDACHVGQEGAVPRARRDISEVSVAWHTVLDADSLGEEEIVGLRVDGRDIALCLMKGEHYAIDNVCSHGSALLSDGFVEDGCVECPLHQGRFDVRTGRPLGAPVTEPIKTYPVKVEDGRVLIEIV